jgi:hypothetical protein
LADLPLRAILKLGQRLDCEFVLRLVACPEHFAQALWLIEPELDGARLTLAWPAQRWLTRTCWQPSPDADRPTTHAEPVSSANPRRRTPQATFRKAELPGFPLQWRACQ